MEQLAQFGASIGNDVIVLVIFYVVTFLCKNKIFVTPAQFAEAMSKLSEKEGIAHKEIMKDVEDRFLTLVAFREFEKRVDGNFKGIENKLEKVDKNVEHIKDILIAKGK